MTPFQQVSLAIAAVWLVLVAVKFRKSTPVLLGGMALIAAYGAYAVWSGAATLAALGLGAPDSWPMTFVWAAGWCALMLAYSPAADWIASRIFAKPPTLSAFRAIQQGLPQLLAGIAAAWILGGVLEEFAFRGVVLRGAEALIGQWAPPAFATALAVLIAALGAGLVHYYQGARAMVIITQLSVLFGVLFVLTGYNLWAVMLCHGFYDTVAFIRFALKKSKYSDLDGEAPAASP